MNWYYEENGQQVGPLTEPDFQQRVRMGKVLPTTRVWNESMTGWQPYSTVAAGNIPASLSPRVTCSQCGRQFPNDAVIRYENSVICASCKPVFFQRLKEGGAVMGGGVWKDKSKLVVARDTALPDRCVKCNAPARGNRLTKKLSWHPPAYFVLICAGAIIYLIVALIVRKQATLQIGVCEKHLKKRKINIIVSLSMIVLSIVMMIVGADSRDLEALAGIGGLLFLVGLIWAVVTTPLVAATKIDDHYIWLRGVNNQYLAGLPDFRP